MADQTNTYEFTYIVNAAISDDQIKDLVKRVQAFIEEHEGKILHVDEWGSRRLARQGRPESWVGWGPPFSGFAQKGGGPVEDSKRGLMEVATP